MISRTTPRFRKQLAALPEHIRRRARSAYIQFRDDPTHRSLRFKKLHSQHDIYSVRISLGYRALGKRDGDIIDWFWIGTHADYDELV